MKILIEIADVAALTADERLALLTLMQIRTNERPAERVARTVAASPAVPDVATARVVGVPIADADRPDAGQVAVPDRMPQVPQAAAVEQPAPVDTAKLFGGQAQQPAAAAPSVSAVPTVPVAVPVPAAATASDSAPAVPAAVPVPPAGADAAPTNALDKAGLPWDERIHASTKAKNADGTWRQKRGVDPATVEQVTASLRALVAIPAVPAPVPPAGASVAVPTISYPELMTKAIEWTSAVPQKISMPQIFEVLQTLGLRMLPDLQHRPDLVQPVHDAIVARIAATGVV